MLIRRTAATATAVSKSCSGVRLTQFHTSTTVNSSKRGAGAQNPAAKTKPNAAPKEQYQYTGEWQPTSQPYQGPSAPQQLPVQQPQFQRQPRPPQGQGQVGRPQQRPPHPGSWQGGPPQGPPRGFPPSPSFMGQPQFPPPAGGWPRGPLPQPPPGARPQPTPPPPPGGWTRGPPPPPPSMMPPPGFSPPGFPPPGFSPPGFPPPGFRPPGSHPPGFPPPGFYPPGSPPQGFPPPGFPPPGFPPPGFIPPGFHPQGFPPPGFPPPQPHLMQNGRPGPRQMPQQFQQHPYPQPPYPQSPYPHPPYPQPPYSQPPYPQPPYPQPPYPQQSFFSPPYPPQQFQGGPPMPGRPMQAPMYMPMGQPDQPPQQGQPRFSRTWGSSPGSERSDRFNRLNDYHGTFTESGSQVPFSEHDAPSPELSTPPPPPEPPSPPPPAPMPVAIPDAPPTREAGSLSFNSAPTITTPTGLTGPRAMRRPGARLPARLAKSRPNLPRALRALERENEQEQGRHTTRAAPSRTTSGGKLPPPPPSRPKVFDPVEPTCEALFAHIPHTPLSSLGQSRILTSALPPFHKPDTAWTDTDWARYDSIRTNLALKVLDGRYYNWDWDGVGGVDGAVNGGSSLDPVRRLVSMNRSFDTRGKKTVLQWSSQSLGGPPVVGSPQEDAPTLPDPTTQGGGG